jgi:hypothetical protein
MKLLRLLLRNRANYSHDSVFLFVFVSHSHILDTFLAPSFRPPSVQPTSAKFHCHELKRINNRSQEDRVEIQQLLTTFGDDPKRSWTRRDQSLMWHSNAWVVKPHPRGCANPDLGRP